MKNDLLKGLTEEQIYKASKCKTNEELLALAKEEGVVLTDEQLAVVSGGGICSNTEVRSTCPKCGAEVVDEVYKGSYNETTVKFTCPKCGHTWTDFC